MSSQAVTRSAHTRARTHLAKLAQAMERRGWRVALTTEPMLIVTGPDGGPVETVVCRASGDGTWHYQWGPGRVRTCPTSRRGFAVVRLDNQLRADGEASGEG